jgi:hypothetical protein
MSRRLSTNRYLGSAFFEQLETSQYLIVGHKSCDAGPGYSSEILTRGHGELLGWHDLDEQRQWIDQNKTRCLEDKRVSVAQAVGKFVSDGCYLASGRFGHIRVPMAVIYEIVRQNSLTSV